MFDFFPLQLLNQNYFSIHWRFPEPSPISCSNATLLLSFVFRLVRVLLLLALKLEDAAINSHMEVAIYKISEDTLINYYALYWN